MNGHLETVKYLFEKGAPVDKYAINCASYSGHLEIVKYLVSVNAYIDTEDSKKIITDTRKYRQESLQILEYRLGHPSYIILDYLEYSL